MLGDITELFIELLDQYQEVDEANSELIRMMNDDEELKSEYNEWCDATGHSEKSGFIDYYHEYIDQKESLWDILKEQGEL